MKVKDLHYYMQDTYPQIILFIECKLLHVNRIVKKIYKNKSLSIILTTQSIGFIFPKR